MILSKICKTYGMLNFILVVATCGASVAENCTYFQSSGGEQGIKELT